MDHFGVWRTVLVDGANGVETEDPGAVHSRTGYRSALANLARVKNLKRGARAFAEEAAHIRSLCPRRPALLDELAGIGG